MNFGEIKLNLFVIVTFYFTIVSPVYSQPFYEGKTITIIQARGPGGTGDLRVKALIPFLKTYIPGNPTIASEYMPGAGGRKATNHIYRSVSPNGLTIGNVGAGLVSNSILGQSGVLYDLNKLIFLGATNSAGHYLLYTRKAAGFDSLEKLRAAKNVRIGLQSVGDDIYTHARIFAYLLGMVAPNFVLGVSATEQSIAMMRGETDARVITADSFLGQHSELIQKGLADVHTIIEIPRGNKHPRLAQVPEIENFAKSDDERMLLAMIRGFRRFGSPYFFPPGTPVEQVRILREALQKAFADPKFTEEFKKMTGENADPLTAEAMEKAFREIPREPKVISLVNIFAGSGPLPSR